MKSLKLSTKLIATTAAILLITTLLLGAVSYLSINTAHNRVIAATKEKLDVIIKAQVDGLIGVLQANYQDSLDGKISPEEAKSRAEHILRTTRYNKGVGYFWADLADGTNAVHIKPEIQGTNRYDTQDAHGNYFVRDTITAGNTAGGGFIEFYFAKPNGKEPLLKRGYVEKFEPYGWYIGTGNYQEDMDALIHDELAISDKQSMTSLISIIIIGFALMLTGILLLKVTITGLLKPLNTIAVLAEQVAHGDLSINIDYSINDEIGRMSTAFQEIVDTSRIQVHSLEALANGDLTQRVQPRGEKDAMSFAINATLQNLNLMFWDINKATQQVATGSGHIADSAQSLAQGSTQQGTVIENLSSSISEIAKNTHINSAMAENAANLAEQIKQNAQKGSEQMDKMIKSVAGINDASQSISKVIRVIDDIAFQTNILALNAAVEAARAGQQGKGFAVVAEEVRNLAAKSAEAAKNTSALIENSMKAAELGATIAAQTAASLDEIVTGINESSNIVKQISQSSNIQSSAISQINLSINQVSQVVQQNSATAQQSSAASQQMSAQAATLDALVAKFKLKEKFSK